MWKPAAPRAPSSEIWKIFDSASSRIWRVSLPCGLSAEVEYCIFAFRDGSAQNQLAIDIQHFNEAINLMVEAEVSEVKRRIGAHPEGIPVGAETGCRARALEFVAADVVAIAIGA